MRASTAKSDSVVRPLLERADICVGGDRPQDITVHNSAFFDELLRGGSLALGETYMDGWWDAPRLDEFFFRVLRAGLDDQAHQPTLVLASLRARLFNPQSRSKSRRVAELHYDLGNDFYHDMLDPWMQYTCGYWRNADNLARAQEEKLDLICRKLQLRPGETVLELGGGWGGFARFAAERYGCRVTTYNISARQVKFAREFCQGLPVEVSHQDYRDAEGEFDKVVSIGICEHVGCRNYGNFLRIQARCLKPDGLMLLHTVGRNTSSMSADPWIRRYIFPGGQLPSLRQIFTPAEGLLVLEDLHNIGADYDPTLMAWYENFSRSWPRHRDRLGERFYRMWTYYLLSCAGAFRARGIHLWQAVFSPEGVRGGYRSIR